MVGKRPIKWRQRPDMSFAVDWDVKNKFKQRKIQNCSESLVAVITNLEPEGDFLNLLNSHVSHFAKLNVKFKANWRTICYLPCAKRDTN